MYLELFFFDDEIEIGESAVSAHVVEKIFSKRTTSASFFRDNKISSKRYFGINDRMIAYAS